MSQNKRFIPNPSNISQEEKKFLSNSSSDKIVSLASKGDKFKGRMVSMSDSFFEQLNVYLKQHPTEGNRSSFIVRVVAEHINKKNNGIT